MGFRHRRKHSGMTQRQKKKPPQDASVPVPAVPDAPHIQAALARYQDHMATVPPGLSITRGESGGLVIDTDRPELKNGMVALMDAVGTHDEHFFSGYLSQIINASTQGKAPDATSVNAALGFIRGLKPRDELEAAMAAQMMATHNAVMTFARRLSHTETIQQQDSAINGYNKLARTFAAQMEALKRYRSTGEQKVTVQHVTVSDGGQAIVGGTVTAGGGASRKEDTTP